MTACTADEPVETGVTVISDNNITKNPDQARAATIAFYQGEINGKALEIACITTAKVSRQILGSVIMPRNWAALSYVHARRAERFDLPAGRL